jgi:hypothetical protein
MPKQSLSRFKRLVILMQKRRMRVPERVPRDPRLPDPIARRRELTVVQVFVVEWCAPHGLDLAFRVVERYYGREVAKQGGEQKDSRSAPGIRLGG